MFSVTRPANFPKSLTKSTKDYRAADVVEVLQDIFFAKCYLCERQGFPDVNIEHRDPHLGDETKKYDWHNLFYACVRCNSIKGDTHINILDCCQSIDVSQAIELHCPLANNEAHKITVQLGNLPDSLEISSTIELLNRCFNETNTALRGISRHSLIKEIQKYQIQLCILKNKLLYPELPLTSKAKTEILEQLKAMCDKEFPFSAFWKWAITRDDDLSKIVGNVF
ncbi:HNH endonuclease [Acinetobacter pittii]|uniref:HNH endonuclease n=1 Tax=Acinetobacter pittii TaxID=48296 RepID=UPI001F06D967|nr:HNH endonuclease [Acinetobacter pittii]MCH2072514.1 HNH endonuclease [Acinetobacter pittii]